MRYSLVGVTTLGFDLVRLPGGAEAAAVLRAALGCGPDELDALARAHPGAAVRQGRRDRIATASLEREALAEVLPESGRAVAEATRGERTTLRRLERGLLGTADGLDPLVRHDVLDWTWVRSGPVAVQDPVASDAADVIVDAATAHYLHAPGDDDLRADLTAPMAASGVAPVGDLLVPTRPDVTRTLQSLSGPAGLARWRAVVDDVRGRTVQWAPAMHRATWALSLADRLRTAADVQLAGVVAFTRSGLTATDAAYGAWNALAGVLHAQLVADLLPAEDADVLLRPWRLVQG